MSPERACLPLLLDGPLQSWGHASRWERRTTALHPTRSGILGLLAAAAGVDKHAPGEAERLAAWAGLEVTVVALPRRDGRGRARPMERLDDYHTVTGIRRASGKVDLDATVQTRRHYLLDARFGALLEGSAPLVGEIAAALRDPRWGVWLGRKCCLPAAPLLAGAVGPRAGAWAALLGRAGYSGEEAIEEFDRVVEVSAAAPGAERIDDAPLGFGRPLGERHAPRWVRRLPRAAPASPA